MPRMAPKTPKNIIASKRYIPAPEKAPIMRPINGAAMAAFNRNVLFSCE